MRLARYAAALLVAAALPCGAQAPQDSTKPGRLALVVGNAAYKDAPLANPLNDAADVAKALEASGFTVIRRENATLKEMHLALREFGDRLTRTTTGLFYFAGHGLQVRGRNYLVPVDADIAREDEVAFAALDLGAVIEKMDSARNPVNILVLDACRNSPFGSRMQLTTKGLAQVEAPPGTLVAFATAPGSVAADGTARNGLYTHHLLGEMRKAGAPIEEVLKAVRAAVRRDSQGRQIPWESTSLETRFAFVEAAPAKPVVAAAAPAPKKGSSPPRAIPTSVGAPPVFAKGDKWTYHSHDLLTGKDRQYTNTVAEIRGDEVVFTNGATVDLLGNPIKAYRGDKVNLHEPTSHWYVFPLRAGDVRKDLTFVQHLDGRTYDATVVVKVVGEEEVETPAGKIRALRLERAAKWKLRGGKASGVNEATYWYSSAVKRWVVMEAKNTTTDGKVLQHERNALVSYQVN